MKPAFDKDNKTPTSRIEVIGVCMQIPGTEGAPWQGTCNGCWNVRTALHSECGKCKVGACKDCRGKWAEQRLHGTHANDAGLLVHQANVCFCGAHLTPRGAALYDRKVIMQ